MAKKKMFYKTDCYGYVAGLYTQEEINKSTDRDQNIWSRWSGTKEEFRTFQKDRHEKVKARL